jgi:glutathione synthase/RimK-type ligase-like ATP-grasp enzyme
LPLRKADLEHLSQVRLAPHLFQRCIEKSCDLRVTIVGAKIFAIRIDSQAGRGKLDWRHDYSVEMVPCELPENLQVQCLDLMKRFGLNYGALDFILSATGEYVFLEINCAGQYLWIEQKTDLKISREVANLLTGKSAPLAAAPG